MGFMGYKAGGVFDLFCLMHKVGAACILGLI
jgi:hypothetical protein